MRGSNNQIGSTCWGGQRTPPTLLPRAGKQFPVLGQSHQTYHLTTRLFTKKYKTKEFLGTHRNGSVGHMSVNHFGQRA